MEIRTEYLTKLVRILRSRPVVAGILVACLVIGIALISVASIPTIAMRETRHFEGQVMAFAQNRDALPVPGAPFDGLGFAEATTPELECGVGIVFLVEPEFVAFQATGLMPPPQLHCDRASARLPGRIVAVFVENQRQSSANWSFDLALFDVSYPYALVGLPAVGLLLVSGLGLPALFLQWAIPRWMGSVSGRDEEEKEKY